MKNKIIAAVSVCMMLMPIVSSATVNIEEELRSQIASLLKQVQELQAKLANMQGQQTDKWCHTFNSELGIGKSGEEVIGLQTALLRNGIITGGFGTNTYDETIASFVSAFQEKYKSEILTPAGLSNGTGYLGARTRAKLNALYGCNVSKPPTDLTCPMISPLPPKWCEGGIITPGGLDKNGCQTGPTCITPLSTNSAIPQL